MAPAGPTAWFRFDTLEGACEALSESVGVRIRALLDRQARVLLAVPGGTSPRHFLETLGEVPLDWGRVTLMPTDERFVAPEDAASNERMLRERFRPLGEGRCGFVSFHGYGSDLEAAASALCAHIATLPPLDILVSGMGADGHIASLFPGDPALEPDCPDSGVAIARPDGHAPRLSLSPGRLLDARWAGLLISGEAKQAVLAAAAERTKPLPVDLLLRRPQGLDVYWGRR